MNLVNCQISDKISIQIFSYYNNKIRSYLIHAIIFKKYKLKYPK